MTKLDELIQELCPEGVAYKTLGEIATDVFRGTGITREQVRETGTPCVRYGEIYTTYGVWFEDCVSHTDETLLTSKKYFDYGDILFAITGESVEDIAKCCAYIGHETCLAGGDIVVLKHNEDPKYLSYALSTLDAQKQKSKGKVKSKVVHSSVPDIKAIRVPVPPLPVQREIVRILDNFTELTAELTTELTARKKQYEYYRDTLLTFGVHREETFETKWRTLAEICDVRDGTHDSPKAVENGKYLITSKNVRDGKIDYTGAYFISEEDYNKINQRSKVDTWDVLFTMIGTVGEVGLVSEQPDFAIKNVGLIKTGDRLLAHFLKHYLVSDTVKQYVAANKSKGTQAFLALGKLRELPIPVMQRQVMERLVNVLDNFDAICSDLNIGLPAEIEARKKQYEYYRDMLLTFAAADDIILTDRQTDRQTEHN